MARTIGRTVNTNDASIISTVALNSVTSITIAAANPNRIHLEIHLDPGVSDLDIFIKLQPASTDDDKKGILLVRNTTGNDTLYVPSWSMPTDNVWTGEICGITEENNHNVHVTEY